MADLGFLNFDEVTVPAKPTTQELLDLLTTQQEASILNGFATRVPVIVLTHKTLIHRAVIAYFYDQLRQIRDLAYILMRQEYVVTPAEIVDGEVVTPAVMNDKPESAIDLRDMLVPEFDFTDAQMLAIVNKMVAYSKHDGSGDWTYFDSNF